VPRNLIASIEERAQVGGAARIVREWAANSSKNRSSFGISACSQLIDGGSGRFSRL
jgi:hypothetical protein